jgi:hypothetical protein
MKHAETTEEEVEERNQYNKHLSIELENIFKCAINYILVIRPVGPHDERTEVLTGVSKEGEGTASNLQDLRDALIQSVKSIDKILIKMQSLRN